ncbi:MAG: hypothetical protein A2W19_02250 [Spirochaetes bacterium RBG_16_49_21]|nr:MAG: hypothetical protein A2W19_02250 [Spirochaetes bacterium RBG_16_49_21]
MAFMQSGMGPQGGPPDPSGSLPTLFQPPGSMMPPPLPDPSSWELALPPPVPKKFHKEIFEFVAGEMTAGAELVRNKLSRWSLIQKLVDGSLKLSQWNGVIEALKDSPEVIENERWQSDFVVGAAPVVHSYVDRLHADLFSTPKYYQVEQEPGIAGGSTEDPLYPTSAKFQALLLHDLNYSQYKTRTYEILVDTVSFGQGFAIPFYNRKEIMRWRRHPLTGQVIPIPEDQNRLVLESIPLHSIVPDVHARHGDTQRWTGVGRRIKLPYSTILQRFRQGIFNVNEKEFAREYKDGFQGLPETYDIELWRDAALDAVMTGRVKNQFLTGWEWHGEVSVSSGPARELIVVVITNRPEDEPSSGVMVRCDHGPALPTGHRPILSSPFTPLAGVFSSGAVQPNLDLIYYMSSMINVLIDNARLSTNVQYKVKRTGSLGLSLKKRKKGNKSYPGKIWFVDDPDDITPFEPLNFPAAAMENLVQYFQREFSKRSNVDDTTLAMAGREKTAHEVFSLGQSADIPLKTRLNIYVENIFEPAGNIFVGMMQTNMKGSTSVPVQQGAGLAEQKIISAEEIRTGSYRVIAAFNKTDQLSVAKAQAMQQLTPMVFSPGVQQALAMESKQLSAWQWIMKIALLLGVDGLEGLFPNVPDQQAQAMQMLQSLPPEQIQQLLQIISAQQQPPSNKGNGSRQPSQPEKQPGTNGTPLGTDDNSNLGKAIMVLSNASRQGGPGGLMQ